MIREYRTIEEVAGPLMLVRQVDGVKYDELGEIELPGGEIRRCHVPGRRRGVLVQPLTLRPALARQSKVSLPSTSSAGVEGCSAGFNGMGEPKTAARIIPDKLLDISGTPINPAARYYPSEFIQTGISTIDGLNTLVRGQKLPIFSGSGLPHAQLAAQIARQAKVRGTDTKFAVVFAAVGITFEEADFFISDFRRTGAIERTVLFMNQLRPGYRAHYHRAWR